MNDMAYFDDFLLALHSNYSPISHRFRDNEILVGSRDPGHAPYGGTYHP